MIVEKLPTGSTNVCNTCVNSGRIATSWPAVPWINTISGDGVTVSYIYNETKTLSYLIALWSWKNFYSSVPCFVKEPLRGVIFFFSGVPNRRVKESLCWEERRGVWWPLVLLPLLGVGGVHNTLKISLDGLRTLKINNSKIITIIIIYKKLLVLRMVLCVLSTFSTHSNQKSVTIYYKFPQKIIGISG